MLRRLSRIKQQVGQDAVVYSVQSRYQGITKHVCEMIFHYRVTLRALSYKTAQVTILV